MPLKFDPDCQAAIDLAKRAVTGEGPLDAGSLLAALYHQAGLRSRFPGLADHLLQPKAQRPDVPEKVQLAAELRPIFQELSDGGRPVSAAELFRAVAVSDTGRAWLRERGVAESVLDEIGRDGQPAPSEWRASSARQAAIQALGSYGRTLTASEPPHGSVVEREDAIAALIRTLSKMKRRNAILVGPAGTGKSAIAYELARRMYRGDPSLPIHLRDMDIFELSPSFLRSGAGVVGEYDQRVKALLQVLQAYPKIILFVDEIHSLFQSGIHERGPFTDANESFKAALGHGDITCIGCTTTAEFRHYIEPDKALERRFAIIRLEPPSTEATFGILQARRAKLEQYYAPLRFPDEVLRQAIELTDEYLPGRYQPDKSIQLVDEAGAFCVTAQPPLTEITEDTLFRALEDMIGHSLVRTHQLTESEVYEKLRSKILGQDEALKEIARVFVAGLGEWSKGSGPRGVFLFGGPTGVGKTETAVQLARILGAGRENLIRVDCNTLPSTAHDGSPVVNRLLGAPPGYVGYSRGQGGILSRIRDIPESIVLFDEFEKGGPLLGRLLLQIIDDGRIEDVDGSPLDFRRAFFVFTTNAGCVYDDRQIGFEGRAGELPTPRTDLEAIRRDLRELGLGEEFIARLRNVVLFKGLERRHIEEILTKQLEGLRKASDLRGLLLEWEPALVPHLAAQWQPRFGVRFATTVLRNRISEQLDIAEAQGELKGMKRILLRLRKQGPERSGTDLTGLASRERAGDAITIWLI